MEGPILYGEKHIETKLSHIGANVSKAIEMVRSAGELLIETQNEIAGLYESLGDVLAGIAGEELPGKAEEAGPVHYGPGNA